LQIRCQNITDGEVDLAHFYFLSMRIGCAFHVPKPYEGFVPARRRSLTSSGVASIEASTAASSTSSHAGTWVDWCSACTHGSGRVRAPHWSCCGALEEDASCTSERMLAPFPPELWNDFDAALTAAESAGLISIVDAGRLRESVRVGTHSREHARIAVNACSSQLADLLGTVAPAATTESSGAVGGGDANVGARGALSSVGSWISNAFQSGAAVAPAAAAAAAAADSSEALPTSADTRRFVSSIRNLRDLAQDAPAEEEPTTEDEAAVKSLPYGGNISAAMKANDRDAIKKIMAHRNAAPKAASVPEPSEAPEPPPAPKSMPRFLRQISAHGNNMSFNPILAEPSEDDSMNSEAAGELEEGEVAADEVREVRSLRNSTVTAIPSDAPSTWFITPPFAGALASVVVTGRADAANVQILARRGSGAWIPLQTCPDEAILRLSLTLPAEVLSATTNKVPEPLEVGLLRVADGFFSKRTRFNVTEANYTLTVHAVKPTAKRIRIKLPATAQPGQLLSVAAPGSTGATVQVKVPPNAVPGSTIEFNTSVGSAAVALPPPGFSLRVVNVNAPALSPSRTQWTKLRVPIPPGPTRPSGVTASAVVIIPPHVTPSGIIKLKVAEVLSPPGGEEVEGDGSLVWKRAQLEARLAPLRTKWEHGRMEIKVARSTFLQSALDALPRNDADWRKTWRFKFEGEPGVDAGGVAREFWSMISAELFSPHAGLFKYSATDQLTYQINPLVTLSF